ncbi:MAG: DUF4271 domain-containing protein [Dysgonomonas sp.]
MKPDTIPQLGREGRDTILYDTLSHNSFGVPLKEEYLDMVKGDTTYIGKGQQEPHLRYDGVLMPFNIGQSDSIFGLLLLCLLFFTHICNGGITFLKENVKLLFSSEKTQRTHFHTTANETLYSYFLVFQSIVLISVCIYDIFIEYDSSAIEYRHPLPTILAFIILIALFFGMKDLIYKILGYIFDRKREFAIWRRTHILSIEILGILYFIPTLLLLYAGAYSLQIIIFMAILFLIVQITLFYQIIIFFIGEKFNFSYLIAYLCTFEILPYIFLFIGLVYLYRIDDFNTLWL